MTAPARPLVAIVSKQRLVGATNGSSAYLLAIAESLRAAGFDVDLIQPSPAIAGRTPYIRGRPELAVFRRHAIRGAIRFGSTFVFRDPGIWWRAATGYLLKIARKLGARGNWAADRPQPYAVASPWLPADKRFLQHQLDPRTSAVIADYMFGAPAFALAGKDLPTAIVMHDLFHARDGKGKDSVSLVSREEEIAALAKADTVFAIQQDEQDFVARHVPGTKALLVPMPAYPVNEPAPGADGELLFIGSNTAPNSEGLRDFLERIWPLILAACPKCRLTVAGTVDRAFTGQSHPNVRFLGMVDNLDRLYAEAGVVISPLTFGSGLKIKLIEALAQGKAMVVSSITLQGVEATCAGAVRRADAPDDAARHVLALANDAAARRQLGQQALDCARANFSAEVVHAGLREWAGQLG